VITLTVTLTALIPRVMTARASFMTNDEHLWMSRSQGFFDALADGRLGDASAYQGAGRTVTMPGITTMWIGVLARGVWALGQGLGIWTDSTSQFRYSALGLDIAQTLYAVVASILVGLVTFLVLKWVSRIAAAVVGLLLATEPYFVAHGAVLHTDELLTLFGVASLIALALHLGVPNRSSWTGQRWSAALAGALFGASWLTKISATMFLPGMALLGLWAVGWTIRPADLRSQLRESWPRIRHCLIWWMVGAGVVILVTYPALWADPINEAYWLVRSGSQGVREHEQTFLGHKTQHPGPAYYFVAIPLRVTAWFLLAGILSLVAIWRRATRRFAIALSMMAVPPLLIITLAEKQFDRYGLPITALIAVATGVVVSSWIDQHPSFGRVTRRRYLAGGLLASLAIVNTVSVAPWGLAYFNPALGGSRAGDYALTVGWGEGFEEAVAMVKEQEGGSCGDATIAGPMFTADFTRYWECPQRLNQPSRTATYYILYVAAKQRLDDAGIERVTKGRPLLGTVTVRGITYAEIYGPIGGPAATNPEEVRLN
jgi:hypothetical protein